jgi:hypothetical protein
VDLEHAVEVEALQVGERIEAAVLGHRVEVVEVEQEVVLVGEDLVDERGLVQRVAEGEVDRAVLEADRRDDRPHVGEAGADDGDRRGGHGQADRQGQRQAGESGGAEVVGVPAIIK